MSTVTRQLLHTRCSGSSSASAPNPIMPSVDPSSTLGASFKRQFETGLYSDLIIKDCNGHEYAVHRSIVCGHSPALANACKPEHGFKEALTGVINLEDEDPDAVKAMLEFMYTGSYKMIDDKKPMEQSAEVYALGEMYNMPELKQHAATKFKEYCSTSWMNLDFIYAVRVIYESIPASSSACTIRETALSTLAEHYALWLYRPEFGALIESFWMLGVDILRTMANGDFPKKTLCKCVGKGEPGHVVELDLGTSNDWKMVDCYLCGRSQASYEWSALKVKIL